MSDKNVALIHRWFGEVWNQGRLETIQELMAPEFIGVGQSGPEAVIRGPRGFALSSRTCAARFLTFT